MSLIAKFSSIFNKKTVVEWKPVVETQLLLLMKRAVLQIQAQKDFIEFLQTNQQYCEYMFHILEEPQKLNFNPSPANLINLISTLHSILIAHHQIDIAKYLKSKTIYWVQNQVVNERLSTEQSTSSIFFQQKENTNAKCNVTIGATKQQIVQEKRNNRMIKNNQQQKIANQLPAPPPPPPPPATMQDVVKIYYQYILKLAFNLDLYRACQNQEYPYCEMNEEVDPKIKFLWLYKIQNIMQLGMSLKDQGKVFQDMAMFQRFVNCELKGLIENYQKLSNLESLSLFEILQENERYLAHSPESFEMDDDILHDFIDFSLKIRQIEKNEKKKVQMKVLRQIDNLKVANNNNNMQIEHIEQCSGQPIITFLHGEEFLNNYNREQIIEEELDQAVEVGNSIDNSQSICNFQEMGNYHKGYEEEIVQKLQIEKLEQQTLQTNYLDENDASDLLL